MIWRMDDGADPPAPGDPSDFDPTSETARADPHTMYRQLRAQCPVARSDAFGGFWAATRRRDIERITTDPTTFSSRFGIIVPRNPASGRRPPMHYDPPEHTAFRIAINPSFRKDRLAWLEPVVRARADELVRHAVERADVDAFEDIASPLAATTVGRLMNLPDRLLEPMTTHAAMFERAQFDFDADAVEELNLTLYALSRELVAERRARPLDPREDMVSGLLAVDCDGDDERLDETVAGSVRQIIVAGHGAPALVLANAIGHLADDAALHDRLRREPERIADAVEELLRLHTPNQGFARTVMADVDIGGRVVPAGSMITIPYTSANRDEAVFDRPDEMILGRTERHLAFGYGVHVCPGAHLGRLQTRVAIEALLAHSSAIIRTGPSTFAPFPVYGPTHLPIRLDPASTTTHSPSPPTSTVIPSP
jgi:cytochrome P450